MQTGDKARGFGLFAAEDIPAGEFVIDYRGEVSVAGLGLLHWRRLSAAAAGGETQKDGEPTTLLTNDTGYSH